MGFFTLHAVEFPQKLVGYGFNHMRLLSIFVLFKTNNAIIIIGTILIVRYSHTKIRKSMKKEINLFFILLLIVVIFIVCNIPRLLINAYEIYIDIDFTR